jgi:hypothetical protein
LLPRRLSWQAAAARAATEQALAQQHAGALAAAQQQHEAHVKGLQDSCRQQLALQERQHLAAMLRCRQLLEEERQRQQAERDGLVQQLTAHYTAAGMQLQTDAAEQSAQLLLQVQQLTQKRDRLQHQLEAAAVAGQQAAPDGSSRLRAGSLPPAAVAAGASAAVQFSRALQAAEADRAAAIKRAAAADAQLVKQEQELQHVQR